MSQIYAPGSIPGPAGPAGPPANFAGVYSSAATYSAGQAVSYAANGNSYVSLTNGNTGNQPDVSPAAWGLLASALVAADVVSPAQMNTAVAEAMELPMYYATAGSTTATIGVTNLPGAVFGGGTSTVVLPGVLPQGSNLESITLHLASTGSVDVVVGAFDGPPGPHNFFTVSDRFTLATADAVELSPGIYQWTAPSGFAMLPVNLPNTHIGFVINNPVCLYMQARGSGLGAGYYEVDGDIGGVGSSEAVYGPQVAADGALDAQVLTRTVPPAPVSGEVRETRTLRVASLKGYNLAAGTAQTIFSATGPGNVERIQIAASWSSPATLTGQNTLINITVDGGPTQTCSLGMFLAWHGYATADGANAPEDLFLSKHLGVTTSNNSVQVSGFRRIYIKYNSSISISITVPANAGCVYWTQVEYYAGAAPTGRFPTTRNVFHMAVNEWATTTIAPNTTLTALPAVTAGGELESLTFVSSAPGPMQPGWLEIAPVITVDGTSFIYGGCEDFFGNQFYGNQLHGRTDEYGMARYFTAGAPDGRTYWSGYRYFRESPMVFNASLGITWQNAGVGNGPATQVGTLAVYYTES